MPETSSGALRPYLVILDEPSLEFGEQIENFYPRNYEMKAAEIFLIKTGDLTSEVKEKLGIGGKEGQQAGVVFRLNGSYAGFFRTSLWGWLD